MRSFLTEAGDTLVFREGIRQRRSEEGEWWPNKQ